MKKALSFFCLFIALFIIAMSMASPVSAIEGIKFFLYQLLVILLPGYAIIKILRIPFSMDFEAVISGYAFGFVLIILEYFLLAPFHLLNYLYLFQAFISISSIICLICLRNKSILNAVPLKDLLPVYGTTLLCILIRFVTYYGRNALPCTEKLTKTVFPTQDILYYIGNAISAGNGFPLKEFRYSGISYFYHYFGSLQLEMASLLTGISAVKLELCLCWVQAPLLLAGFIWCLLQRMNIKNSSIWLAELLFFFTTGWESIIYIAIQEKMYVSSFGLDMGIAFLLATLYFVYLQDQKGKFHTGIFLASILCLGICTGLKAPSALVLLVILGGTCAKWLFIEKKHLESFSYGVAFILVFLLVFFGIVSAGFSTSLKKGQSLYFSLTGHLYESGLGHLYFSCVDKGMPQPIAKVLIFIAYFLGSNLVVYMLFYIAIALSVFTKKKEKIISFESCLALGAVVGLFMTLLTKQQGNSQMYFAISAFPAAIIYGIRYLDKISEKSNRQKAVFYAIIGLTGLLSVGCFVKSLAPAWQEGIKKLSGEASFSNCNNSLTMKEYQAYQWIRENTEPNALFLCNTVIHDDQYENYTAGAFSERQMWMEGWRYTGGSSKEDISSDDIANRRNIIKNVYQGNPQAISTVKDNGIQYIIWLKRYDKKETWCENLWNTIYENDDVVIYKLI